MTHYERLGCHRQMTPDEMRETYYALIKTLHPDVAPTTGEQFAEASKAWRTLGSTAHRRAYDQYLDLVGLTCEACEGQGAIRHQRGLYDVYFTGCPACGGAGVTGTEG